MRVTPPPPVPKKSPAIGQEHSLAVTEDAYAAAAHNAKNMEWNDLKAGQPKNAIKIKTNRRQEGNPTFTRSETVQKHVGEKVHTEYSENKTSRFARVWKK